MANFRRKRPRIKARGGGCWDRAACTWPAYWDRLYHTRPRRRAERRAMVQLMQGDDPDGIVWPTANHKPHNYYW